jgi:hypothetical protein
MKGIAMALLGLKEKKNKGKKNMNNVTKGVKKKKKRAILFTLTCM